MKIDLEKEVVYSNNGDAVTFKEILTELRPFEDDVIYLGGSLVEGIVGSFSKGMGNSYSDVDVFIIREHRKFSDTKAEYNLPARKIYFSDGFPLGLDIEVFDRDYILEFASALMRYEPKADERSWSSIASQFPPGSDFNAMVTFMNRLKNSVCIHNHTQYEELRSLTDFGKFLLIRRDNYIVQMDNIFPDISGNLEAKQYDVALFCMRELFMLQISAVLCHENVSFDNKKWLPLKFSNYVGQTGKYRKLWDVYQELFRGQLTDDPVCAGTIERAVKICKSATEEMILGDLVI
jgi:hypothetical protein